MPPDSGHGLAGNVVLLVEDNTAIRGLIQMVLESRGATVLTAGDGQQALEVARQYEGRIHLLLSDVDMPNINGLELADLIKQQRPETKLLYMSGGATLEGIPMLRKPFALDVLERTVSSILKAEP